MSSDAEPVPAPAAEPEQPAEPPREYRTQPFRVTVAPATKEPCPREDTSLAELHFSNACVEHSDQGVRLGVMSRGGTGLTWKILSKQDTGRVRFLEIEESVPIRRPGEKVLLEAIEVRAVIPLSNAPGKYTLRVNDACVPFEVKAKVPEKDAAVRICLRDDPFRF
ncbi:MAG: hypothetical protein H6718_11910 [Polyangiaceae bacterium]|nr:hypothetical protein [Myxococcales bacterium]MCB9586097.1 hypothetical protein [Polyangiaceae bacterium]MCB9608886.1 hypothetical protein [Polyangiaceae bacterium]